MKTAMSLQFWGVRGSIPAPGPTTMRYGGNTACVSVDLGHNTLLVLDAGTGIRALGEELAARDSDIFVLLSHAHWDHIQGFPFFAPLYQPHRTISIFSTRMGHTLWCLFRPRWQMLFGTVRRLVSLPSIGWGMASIPKGGHEVLDRSDKTYTA
jgi:ribonuclease BN (tRNA processing enzyme)